MVLTYHMMLGLADSLIDPARENEFAQFLDVGFASVVAAPGYRQWWNQFKPGMQVLYPTYHDRIEALDTLDMIELLPWFAPDDSEMGA